MRRALPPIAAPPITARAITAPAVAAILALAVAAVLSGCRSAPAPAEPPDSDAKATPPTSPAVQVPEPLLFVLPADWREMTDLAFERALDGWLPPGETRRCTPEDLAVLEQALDPVPDVSGARGTTGPTGPSGANDIAAIRAAVLLARTKAARAGEILLARLEKRWAPPAGQSERNAADVVAAAAFAEGAPATNAAVRLAGLAGGKRPHPDLCVRVECARSALRLGRDEGIPFLLQVLRTGTTAGRTLAAGERPEDLAWAQVRAAEALSVRAGTERRFRPEASVHEREEDAARLEKLLPPRQ